MQIKFPKFDPLNGMVTCVRLCVAITGVIDSVSIENNSASPDSQCILYPYGPDYRSGTGYTLSNSINYHLGPYSLGGSDGVLGSSGLRGNQP